MWRDGRKTTKGTVYYQQYGDDMNITISWSDSKDNFLLHVYEPIAAFGTLEGAKKYYEEHYE